MKEKMTSIYSTVFIELTNSAENPLFPATINCIKWQTHLHFAWQMSIQSWLRFQWVVERARLCGEHRVLQGQKWMDWILWCKLVRSNARIFLMALIWFEPLFNFFFFSYIFRTHYSTKNYPSATIQLASSIWTVSASPVSVIAIGIIRFQLLNSLQCWW